MQITQSKRATYYWCTSSAKMSYRSLIVEMIRSITPGDTSPVVSRVAEIDIKLIATKHCQCHDTVKNDPNDKESKASLDTLSLWMDRVWTFLETWTFMEMPGYQRMKEKHNQIDLIRYDMQGPDILITFIYKDKTEYVNVYLDEEYLAQKVPPKIKSSIFLKNGPRIQD